jgi:hypothetical protein
MSACAAARLRAAGAEPARPGDTVLPGPTAHTGPAHFTSHASLVRPIFIARRCLRPMRGLLSELGHEQLGWSS